MTDVDEQLPRWSVADVHESFDARSFTDELDRVRADVDRLVALFDELGIREVEQRAPTIADGAAADRVISAINDAEARADVIGAYVYATVATDSYDERAQGLASELEVLGARQRPLTARLAAWVASLGPDQLATVSAEADEHLGPLRRLAARATHQMPESDESLHAELVTTGTLAWGRLHSDVTSQLSADVAAADGSVQRLPMAVVRGLASHADPFVRRAAYDAEMAAWPSVAVTCAAALNSIKGEANTINRRRGWPSPLDASLFANGVGRTTFDAMQAAVHDALPDFRRWLRVKAALHGHADGLPWYDLFAPLPFAPASISWSDGLELVRRAFGRFGGSLGGLVDRAVDERWIDASPRDGKQAGAFCMPFVDDRSLVFLNWNGSVEAAQTTAHELGHAYHNTQLAHRTPLQRQLPMALAETASIFCETLVVEAGLDTLEGSERLSLLDVDLQNAAQVVVDIHSRFRFETEVFAARQRRTLGVGELNELMLAAQADAYGDGLDQTTAHPYMWAVKGHYYGSHFYNWPYTYGLLFGLGLFARYRSDPERFAARYDDLLSRAGMDTAEQLGQAFDLDVNDVSFWTASLDVVRDRISQYEQLATVER